MKSHSFKGHTETIKSLIAQGKDINARNIRGQTPLHLAAAKGNSDVVQLLLENGAEVDAVATDSGCTSLHYAASLGHVELCELLVRYGADPDAQTARLETPLHLAVASGHSDVVALLLKYHARLDIRDTNGMTPLQQAETVNKQGDCHTDQAAPERDMAIPDHIARLIFSRTGISLIRMPAR